MIAVCMLFTSCLHPISIDNCGYVVVIGVDEGAEERYEITFELQRESSGEAQENNGGAIILSVEVKDIFDAVNIISRGIEYDLNFTRTHALIFSEKIARNGEIGDFMDFSFDVLRIRRSALMIVTECGVREYIGGLAANNDANIAKLQDDLISDMEMTGELAAINIAHFLEACEEGRFDAVMPVGHYDGEIITDTKQHDSASKATIRSRMRKEESGSAVCRG